MNSIVWFKLRLHLELILNFHCPIKLGLVQASPFHLGHISWWGWWAHWAFNQPEDWGLNPSQVTWCVRYGQIVLLYNLSLRDFIAKSHSFVPHLMLSWSYLFVPWSHFLRFSLIYLYLNPITLVFNSSCFIIHFPWLKNEIQ